MTSMEAQLYAWLRDEPQLTQKTLAERSGLSRSQVSKCVGSLVRQGMIPAAIGSKPYVAVVGGVNIDISGTPSTKLLSGDSNPGVISTAAGGVGRNIAENLARLGLDVRMVTALGNDDNGARIRSNCQEVGIDLSYSVTIPGARTSTYLCLNDVDGDVLGAVSDMAIYDNMTPEMLAPALSMLNGAALVVLDANLSREAIKWLCSSIEAPIFADPVSVKKAGHFADVLDKLTALKPNRPEASLLSGVEIRTEEDLPLAAQAFFAKGLHQVFISLGGRGVYFNDGRESGILHCLPTPVHNTNGCGDAFLAAAAMASLKGCSLKDMARHGLAASAINAQADSAVSPQMSPELLMAYV